MLLEGLLVLLKSFKLLDQVLHAQQIEQAKQLEAFKQHQQAFQQQVEQCQKLEAVAADISHLCSDRSRKLEADMERQLQATNEFQKFLKLLAGEVNCCRRQIAQQSAEFQSKLNAVTHPRDLFQPQIDAMTASFKALEQKLTQGLEGVKEEVQEIKGPMTDLISNQEREIQSIVEELRRKQYETNGAIEQVLRKSESPIRPSSSRLICGSPTVSLKQRCHHKTRGLRLNFTTKPEDNWFKALEDGQLLSLPRVKDLKQPKAKNVSTISLDLVDKRKLSSPT